MNIVSQFLPKDDSAIMEFHALLRYMLAFCILVLFVEERECTITQNPNGANVTSRVDPSVAVNDDDDDFVPYQGERFNVFDWMLFKVIGKSYSGNVLISPISIKMALVLLYEGAQDETANELSIVMQLPASRPATRDKFSNIFRSLQTASPAYTLDIGTRLYIDSNVLTRQRYEAILKSFYDTDVINTNMSDVYSVAKDVNSWVRNLTDGNIDKMIEDEKSVENSVMLIMNAMFFKGTWQRKYFSPENTKLRKFYVNTNESIDVPFMHTVTRLYYSVSPELNAKILRIPYGGQKFAMYLILPYTVDGINHLIENINPFLLTRHVWLMQDLPIDLAIPKFKLEFSSHLESVLREVGIQHIFDDTATLTGIARTKRTSRRLRVSDIFQKTGIEVNENGTLGYTATEVQVGNKIEDETFHATRPFVFYIEDETTGTILYMGKVANPLEAVGSIDSLHPETPTRIGEDTPNTVSQSIPTPEERYNFFNVDLLQAIHEKHEGNVVLSPASAKLAMTILAEGIGGRSRSELLSTLRFPDDQTKIREIARRTFAPLKRSQNGTESDSATRLWVREDLQVSPVYVQTLQRYYGAGVQHTDFANTRVAAANINEWIRRVTKNKITSLTDSGSITAETSLLLTSALYFKGRWLKSFDKKSTVLRCFNEVNVGCQKTYFMENLSTYRYAYIPSLEADIVEIPYSDRKTSMLILLPSNQGSDPNLRILSKDLSYIPVSVILSSLEETELKLSIPKFSIESNLDLLPPLMRMGINDIFGATANLTGIVNDYSMRIASILQKAKIEVDEDGTTATAVTIMEITPLIGISVPVFRADRPFIFMIIDLETKGTLFSGRISQPVLNNVHNTQATS